MAFLTNLLRKLRRPKTKNVKEKIKPDEISSYGFPGTYRAMLIDAMGKDDEPKGFQGDLLNGWEEDGEPGQRLVEPKHWHNGYFPPKKK